MSEVNVSCLLPECREFPKDFGVINVLDFGAKGDGIHDDTNAIRSALMRSSPDNGRDVWKNRIVYFPEGVYLVSAPLWKRYEDGRFASGMHIVGKSIEKTIIRLRDSASGYGDQSSPKAVIYTSSKLLDGTHSSGGKDYYGKGEGNDAYMNYIENMTIDVGANNMGAIGIDYLANNMGAVRHVKLIAQGNSGVTGISMTRKWPGPALLSHVMVEGFNTAIDIAHTEYGITLDEVSIVNPRSTGIKNTSNMISAHNIYISGAPLPILNTKPDGLITISGGNIDSKSLLDAGVAIKNEGYLNLYGVKIEGYTHPNLGDDNILSGVFNKDSFISESKWSLPIKDTPKPPLIPVSSWVNVNDFGADINGANDSTFAISKAFSSGAEVIYFPYGTYLINANIKVPETVKYIVGMGAVIRPYPKRINKFKREYGMFRVVKGDDPLTITGLVLDHTNLGRQVGIELMGARTLSLRDVVGLGVTTILRRKNGGEVFLENTCCGLLTFKGAMGVWGRQINTEGGGTRIRNYGGKLWLLGVKAEGYNTLIDNRGAGRIEMVGGLIYIVRDIQNKPVKPAFINKNSKMHLSFVEEAFLANSIYKLYIDGGNNMIWADDFPSRNKGRMVVDLQSND